MGDSPNGAAITTFDTMTIDADHDIQRQLLATDVSGATATYCRGDSKQDRSQLWSRKFTFMIPRRITKTQIKSCQFRTRDIRIRDISAKVCRWLPGKCRRAM